MFKITSRFYVIYGDGLPIYVGYTNRTVKQRFREHKEDKDFSGYTEVHVEELKNEKMSFEFTWDYEKTCYNASIVAHREEQLVNSFDTQNSEYQKAVGGGQTWSSEKHFVLTNRDNPKFKGMNSADVKKIILARKEKQVWLRSFVCDILITEQKWLGNFIKMIKSEEQIWVNGFISRIHPREKYWLSSFVENIQQSEKDWIHSFVNNMQITDYGWISSFISRICIVDKVWISNFISRIKPTDGVWLHSFVGNI